MRRVVVAAMSLATVVYATTALSGYVVFGDHTMGDVMKNFAPGYRPAQIGRLGLAFLVMCTFPLAHHALRANLISLWWKGRYTSDTLPTRVYVPLTAGVVAFAVTIGITVDKVQDVLAYNGAVFGSAVVFVYPAIMLCALTKLRAT